MRTYHYTETFWGVVLLPQLWYSWPARNTKQHNLLAKGFITILENVLVQVQRLGLRSRRI